MHVTKTFRDLDVHDALCKALDERGITHPFPIQELTLPLALEGNDLIGQARTGTGKTLAFGLPLLQRIDPSRKVTQALVIAPTRELANQVHEDLSIGEVLGLSSHVVYGGVGYDEQIEALTGGAHVVVGTPGRLLDLLNRNILDLSNVSELVLDEADEMLDMGFLPDVERLIEACQGQDRHTMLFSATMPTAIVRLARRYMHHPTFTRADHEEKNTAPEVTQFFFQVHRMDKPRVLARILQSPNRGGVYVFVRTKHMADRLVQELEELGIPAIPIHGDLRQSSREKNLERFRQGKATVLVATEVAARGLDVTGVTHVVNYDCPDDEKMYLHRIGRTARAGASGVAVTFAEFNEADRLNVIRKKVGATDTEVLPIFSTSDELVDLFDLPAEKPWDAKVKTTVDEYHDRRGGKGRDPGRKDPGKRDRQGRSDGRPKNDRAREGQGEQQSARPRPGGSREDTGRKRANEKHGAGAQEPKAGSEEPPAKTDTGSSQGDRDRSRDRGTGQERVRTRTRSRTRDDSRADERSRTTRGGSGQAEARDGDQGPSRQRARKRGADGGSERDRGQAQAGGRPARAKDTDGGSDQRSEKDGQDDQRSGGKRGASGGGRNNRGKGGRPSGGRSGGKRSGGRDDDQPSQTLARRGREARGEGQPQLARRVKVDKLP